MRFRISLEHGTSASWALASCSLAVPASVPRDSRSRLAAAVFAEARRERASPHFLITLAHHESLWRMKQRHEVLMTVQLPRQGARTLRSHTVGERSS
jgi:hypothetical protein